MSTFKAPSFILTLFLLFATLITLGSSLKQLGTTTITAVIMFGDSIVDTGNNNNLATISKCNFPPYGRDFEGGKPTGRFSNGKVPSDIIVEKLGIKNLLPPYNQPYLNYSDLLNGVNFASGGSGYDPLTSLIASATSLEEQLKKFKDYIEAIKSLIGEDGVTNLISNAIFFVVESSNDIINTFVFSRQQQYDIDSYTTFLSETAASFIKELHEVGARKIGVFGAPPLGCLPSQRFITGGAERACNEAYNNAARLFNNKLVSAIDSANGELRDATVAYIDIFTPLMDVIMNSSYYGFKIVKKGCCGTGNMEVAVLCNKFTPCTCQNSNDYVFWDSFHPTERAYEIIINNVFQNYLK